MAHFCVLGGRRDGGRAQGAEAGEKGRESRQEGSQKREIEYALLSTKGFLWTHRGSSHVRLRTGKPGPLRRSRNLIQSVTPSLYTQYTLSKIRCTGADTGLIVVCAVQRKQLRTQLRGVYRITPNDLTRYVQPVLGGESRTDHRRPAAWCELSCLAELAQRSVI